MVLSTQDRIDIATMPIEDILPTGTWDDPCNYGKEPSEKLVQLLQECLLQINSRPNRNGNPAPLAKAVHALYLYTLELEPKSTEPQAPSN